MDPVDLQLPPPLTPPPPPPPPELKILIYVCIPSLLLRKLVKSRFHDGLILFQFDTIAPNLVPLVSNDLVQLSEWEQMKKGTKIKNRFVRHDLSF